MIKKGEIYKHYDGSVHFYVLVVISLKLYATGHKQASSICSSVSVFKHILLYIL